MINIITLYQLGVLTIATRPRISTMRKGAIIPRERKTVDSDMSLKSL